MIPSESAKLVAILGVFKGLCIKGKFPEVLYHKLEQYIKICFSTRSVEYVSSLRYVS